MRLLLFFFIIFVVSAQSQTNASSVLRESSLNISIDNKHGKEFYYRKQDGFIYNSKCVILVKNKNAEQSKSNKTKGIYSGFKEKGVFNQGYKNGKWKTTYKNKVVKEENWYNGLIIGAYKVTNTKEKLLYEIVFPKKGKTKYKDYYYKTGQLKVEGNYLNGKKQGEWHFYDEKGTKTKTIKYANGVVNN